LPGVTSPLLEVVQVFAALVLLPVSAARVVLGEIVSAELLPSVLVVEVG
jgi:hypothetical protein